MPGPGTGDPAISPHEPRYIRQTGRYRFLGGYPAGQAAWKIVVAGDDTAADSARLAVLPEGVMQ